MQSFQRAFALFSIVAVLAFFVGCGGQGTPVSGAADPAEEAANAALAPEGGPPTEAAAADTGGAATEATEPAAADKPAADSPEAASAPE